MDLIILEILVESSDVSIVGIVRGRGKFRESLRHIWAEGGSIFLKVFLFVFKLPVLGA